MFLKRAHAEKMMLFADLFKGNHSVEFIWLPMFSTQITRHKRLKKDKGQSGI